jgi:hypothetical protein
MTKAVELAIDAARGQKLPSAVDPLQVGGLPLVITQANLAKYPKFDGQYSQ